MISNLKKCVKCDLPETYETIEFNDDGVCNICQGANFKNKNINWTERKNLLDKLIEKYRDKSDYDCIIPFSGGKDSTFTLYYLIKEYNIKPLVVRFNHGFMRENVQENNLRTFKKLGVDVIEFIPNWNTVKKLMFESFKRKTDFCWHCHTGIYSYPLRIALKFKTPLVFWGEPQSEITAYYDYLDENIEYEDDKKFNMIRTLGITAEDMHGMIDTKEDPVDIRDLTPYTFPDIEELKSIKYCSVPLGSFIPWDYKKNTEIIKKELGWTVDELEGVPKDLNPQGEKTECFMQGTRDYVKYLKRGYSRVSQINAFDVRSERITSEQAQELNSKYDGRKPHSLDIFLEYMGINEREFNEIIKPMVIHPHDPDFKNICSAEKTWDFEKWYREDNLKNK